MNETAAVIPAEVATLTVHRGKAYVLMIGDWPLSASMFEDLSAISYDDIDPIARVRQVWLIGYRKGDPESVLVRSNWLDLFDEDDPALDKKLDLEMTARKTALSPYEQDQLTDVTRELEAVRARIRSKAEEFERLPVVLLVEATR